MMNSIFQELLFKEVLANYMDNFIKCDFDAKEISILEIIVG